MCRLVLFGAGVAQQWRSLEGRGQDVRAFHMRRMAFLVPVGLTHAVLLRNGDVLAPYAVLGMVLVAVYLLRQRLRNRPLFSLPARPVRVP